MKSLLMILVIVALVFSLVFCKTTPEPEPEPEPEPQVVEVEPEPEPEPEPDPQIKPVSDAEIAEAKKALEKAKAGFAEIYAPDLYEEGVAEFDEALDLKDSDPDAAREHLKRATRLGEEAYNASVMAMHERYLKTFANYERKLSDLEADKFESAESADLYARSQEVEALYQAGKHGEAKAAADSLVEDLKSFYETLDENIRWSKILKRDTERYMDDADSVEAFIWAPELLEEAVIKYAMGLEAYRNWDLDGSIEYMGDAKGLSLKAVRTAPERKAEYTTNALMEEVGADIDSASTMTIMTEDGRLIEPGDMDEDDQSFLLLTEPTIGVLGDVSEVTLLDQARELWQIGVEEKEKGNWEQADEYFKEAGRLVHAYKAMAVGNTKPVNIYDTYTLWFISDKEYGNAFLWPIVWLYNTGLIENPDLIYPGWKIMIPLSLP